MKAAVTKSVITYGAPTIAAVSITEAKVAWKVKPAVTAATTSFTIAGSTTANGYVYCMVQKEGTRLLATNTTANKTVANKTVANKTVTPVVATASTAAFTRMRTDANLKTTFTWKSA